jgi:antitoxin component YwqK of YwqJK toxin-antitoxin module
MKKFVIIAGLMISGLVQAQALEPQFEVIGNRVQITYFYDNGRVQQQGFYKDGKLDGAWTSYDEQGNKLAVGTYAQGQKVGEWSFWSGSQLSRVRYTDNQIAYVSKN